MTTVLEKRPRTNHLELAQRILQFSRESGWSMGSRLPEQVIADHCNVSRTPVRAALRVLAEQGAVTWAREAGYRLAIDPADWASRLTELPSTEEQELSEAILRDRSARRLNETVTVAALMRRYRVKRQAVQKAVQILSDSQLIERAPGQLWVFRPMPDGIDALAESYEFRLLMEPAALAHPGFRLDEAMSAVLRHGMDTLAAQPESAFDVREFLRLDVAFHIMIAQGSANRFMADALIAHLKLRQTPNALAGVNAFRLKQSLREHLAILEHLERRQFDVAADLLRVHLRLSRNQRPQAANRGAPALFGSIDRPR